jgi:threonyl-tRNA synthetase
MINIKEDKKLNILNHSCAHLMAQAIRHLYPEAKFWVGPVIDEGFYYDMDLNGAVITDADLEHIEKEMHKIAKDGKKIIRHEISKKEALEMFKGDPYKIDLINDMPKDEIISCYTQGDFTDLCRGPHIESVKELKYFKLLKFSGSYYKGDAKNKPLQRIYGVAFYNQEDLDKYMAELQDARERDHRKLGKDLEIFMLSDLVGKGLPMYLPKGATLRRTLDRYITDKEIEHGYLHVTTPSVGSVELYKTSGHWEHYKDDMFPAMQLDDEAYVLRPMNCPHHMMIYKNSLHSYRDLPIRIAEIANDFRFEASGAVKGIERARSFTQNDSHIFCRSDQIGAEFKEVLDLIMEVYKDFDIKDYKCRLSLRDPNDKNDKYFKDDDMWNNAENDLRKVLNELHVDYYEAVGEAAFYGPKLDVLVKPAVGPEVALSTIQLDFLLPRRFELTYVDENGNKVTPVVIHRAILGSLDRFIAFLLEETKGVLPVWLAPVQATIIPVNNKYHFDYAQEVEKELQKAGMRVELDAREEKVGYKLREIVIHKVPYILILGDKERDAKTISFRKYGSEETETLSVKDFVKIVNKQIENKD